jgi:hypothetical protein
MKLTLDNKTEIIKLFNKENAFSYSKEIKFDITKEDFVSLEHEIFATNYLGQLKNWHSFINDNKTSSIVCYQSEDEPSWYLTNIYGTQDINSLIQEAVLYNESYNYYKFYVAIPIKDLNNFNVELENYEYFDEVFVKEKSRCFYTTFWQLLYRRTLPDKDTIIRCYYMKQSSRKFIPQMSNI